MSVLVIRAHKRFAVCRKVRLRKPGRRGIDGLLIELSLEGCRVSNVDLPAGVVLGEAMTVRVPGAGPLAGRVRWVREGSVGLRFDRPLHNTALEALIRLCRDGPVAARAYGT